MSAAIVAGIALAGRPRWFGVLSCFSALCVGPPEALFDLFFCKAQLLSQFPSTVSILMHLFQFFIVLFDMGYPLALYISPPM